MVKQERAARTRRSLIRAAAEVFAREGFVPASLTTISRRAGVSNGALHFHFDTKEALARAVEEEAGQEVRLLTERCRAEGTEALQLLVDATHALMRGLDESVVVRAGFELSGDISRTGGLDLRRQWRRWIESVLQRAASEGNLADGVSPDDVVCAVMAATVGFEVLGARDDKEWISRRTLTRFWELILPRIAARRALDTVVTCGSCSPMTVPGPCVEKPA
ncbi:ScbR family autoregulator-binding transcription factor [Streptomyces sp. AK02-01A]|uniref:ScbR family autoregulator-binding transcription factor n=1 Tax=Streptomyces sp. AK02-01A TaxID=3028648 RepID=UPI0029BA8283|nr:ScbR family autoregulator-binding transcription factor [Streptomyces sp. AK02-01A]MDX3850030.1 ScbR family autoregulator-binding transcription factor [Streptomyces sp. AK02-01A]